VMFVDEFDQENSRDIEPMKGGHGDNYYYQLVAGIRKYKGARQTPVAGPAKTIDINGDFAAWNGVTPEYRDAIDDTYPRNHPGYNTATRYVDNSGRNDLVSMKVSRDAQFVYFYARTKDPMTPHTDPHWMMLFIDIDRNHATGWEGYDFVVNSRVKDATVTFLERTRTGWNWHPTAEVKYRVLGNEMMLAIAKKDLGLDGEDTSFEFKWVDNMQLEGNIDSFTLNGDSAPPGRFNFWYNATKQ